MNKLTRPVSGRQSGITDKEKRIAPEEKKRQKAAIGRHMRTFSRTKKREDMTAYNVDYYAIFLLHTVNSNTFAYLGDAALEAYTRGQQVGNMKDEEATQKDALDKTTDYAGELLFDLAAQWPFNNLFSNFAKVDTVTVPGTPAIANYENSTMTDILQKMDKLMLPSFLKSILQTLNFYVKLAEGWKDVNNNEIPGRYLFMRIPMNAATTNKTLIDNIWTEQGELKNHCKKFGIKLEKFDVEWLTPREVNVGDKDFLAFRQACSLVIRATAANARLDVDYDYHADQGELKRWWFVQDPNESNVNYLVPMLNPYNATYNKYGGQLCEIEDGVPAIAETAGFGAAFIDSNVATIAAIDMVDILELFLAVWEDGSTNFEFQGTAVANKDINISDGRFSWKDAYRSLANDGQPLFYGTGIDETSKDESFLSYLIELMF